MGGRLRVKLGRLPLLMAELKQQKFQPSLWGWGFFLVTCWRKLVGDGGWGVDRAGTHLTMWGTSGGQLGGMQGTGGASIPPEWSPAPPPKASGFQASWHRGQRTLSPCQPSCSWGLWPGPLIKLRALCLQITALKTKVQGCLWVPSAFPVRGLGLALLGFLLLPPATSP